MPRHNDKAPKRQVVLFSEKILLNNDTCSNKDSMLSKLYCCLKKTFPKNCYRGTVNDLNDPQLLIIFTSVVGVFFIQFFCLRCVD